MINWLWREELMSCCIERRLTNRSTPPIWKGCVKSKPGISGCILECRQSGKSCSGFLKTMTTWWKCASLERRSWSKWQVCILCVASWSLASHAYVLPEFGLISKLAWLTQAELVDPASSGASSFQEDILMHDLSGNGKAQSLVNNWVIYSLI